MRHKVEEHTDGGEYLSELHSRMPPDGAGLVHAGSSAYENLADSSSSTKCFVSRNVAWSQAVRVASALSTARSNKPLFGFLGGSYSTSLSESEQVLLELFSLRIILGGCA
jgi:hypothetical protein